MCESSRPIVYNNLNRQRLPPGDIYRKDTVIVIRSVRAFPQSPFAVSCVIPGPKIGQIG